MRSKLMDYRVRDGLAFRIVVRAPPVMCDGIAISGATSSKYTLTRADVGKAITVAVTWTDTGGKAETLTSAATSSVAGVTLSKSSVTVTEASGSGNTATYTLVLDVQPSGDVTITPTSSDTGVATVSAALTFTTSNWNTAQAVTVTGVDDAVDSADRTTTISHNASGGRYGGVSVADVSVTVTDDDAAGVMVTESEGSTATTESGGSDTVSVVLDSQPTANVVIGVSSSDASEGTVTPASLTFTTSNWDMAQEITVTGVDDNLTDGDQSYNIVLAAAVSTDSNYSGEDADDVAVTNADDDIASVTLSKSSVTVTEAIGSGRSTTYTVVLDVQPGGDVTITPTSSDTGVATVSPASLTFTTSNWDTAQTITVTGVDDSTDWERTTTISHNASGGGYGGVSVADVSVTLTDDDTAGVTVSKNAVTVTEAGGAGRSTIYTLVLNTQPSGEVTITPVSSDSDIATVSPSRLTFTRGNWDQAQPVIVTGVEDDEGEDRRAVVRHSISGGGYASIRVPSVAVTVQDDDIRVMTSTSSINVDESGDTNSANYEVSLSARPSGKVTVGIRSEDRGVATVTPSRLTFTPSNWERGQRVTVTGVDDGSVGGRDTTITHTPSGGGYDADDVAEVGVIVHDTDSGILISKRTLRVDEALGEHQSDSYSIVLGKDPGEPVTITPTTEHTDMLAISPLRLVFTSANWDQPQKVIVACVTDDIDRRKNLRALLITHKASGGSYDKLDSNRLFVSVKWTDDDEAGVTVSESSVTVTEASGVGNTADYTVVLTSQPTGKVIITPVSSDPGVATVSAALTFTPSN